jgi:hypothetical protein
VLILRYQKEILSSAKKGKRSKDSIEPTLGFPSKGGSGASGTLQTFRVDMISTDGQRDNHNPGMLSGTVSSDRQYYLLDSELVNSADTIQ